MNLKDQGENSHTIFHGNTESEASRLMYRGSALLFSEIIRSNLKNNEYTLADLGSSKGEFLNDLIKHLPEYNLKTIAIDINEDDIKINNADKKIVTNLTNIPLDDKSVDITTARYVLSWNNIADQKKIIEEIKRITKHIAIIQHQGANTNHPNSLQESSKILFNGIIPQLKRDNFFFSTSTQIEDFMNGLNISFKKIQERDVEGLSNIFIEKYNLSEIDTKQVKEILRNSDYITQSTWVLNF